jgi:FMN reductase
MTQLDRVVRAAPMTVLGIGGSTRPGSSTEAAIRAVLDALERRGAEVEIVTGVDLALPPYEPGMALAEGAERLVEAVRAADALVIGSPGYHGSLSGFVKNAIDYVEECREDEFPYLAGRPVGLVVTAYGWQAAINTLSSLRNVVHALRGWPTPLGIPINVAAGGFEPDRRTPDAELRARVEAMADELVSFVEGGPALTARQVRDRRRGTHTPAA